MPWTYSQSTGEMDKLDGTLLAFGFAGRGPGLNNPLLQDTHSTGPIPQGRYRMTNWIEKHQHMGLCVIELTPEPGTILFGRSEFYIHGARSLQYSGLKAFLESSQGCIVIGDCTIRRAMWLTGDRELVVVA